MATSIPMNRGYAKGPYGLVHYRQLDARTPLIRHRALIITNTGDMVYEHARNTKRMRPDFEYVELEGGGVDIVDQQPEAWVNAVVAFLNG